MERFNLSQLKEIAQKLSPEISLLICIYISSMAFSSRVKGYIDERDKHKSRESGSTEHLEAAHYNHNKKDPLYNHSSNGRLLTTQEHYMDHYRRHWDPELGLTRHQNRWTLNAIWKRMTKEEQSISPPPPSYDSDDGMQRSFVFDDSQV